jgi:hypothetical protein
VEQQKIQEQGRVDQQAIRDQGKADAEERERQRVHAQELAAEKRKKEIQRAAEKGDIDDTTATALLGEERKTPILRFEKWISDCLRCPTPAKCSSSLGKLFKAAVTTGDHVKPQSHWDSERQGWRLFEEHDAKKLKELHDNLHKSKLPPGQRPLSLHPAGPAV